MLFCSLSCPKATQFLSSTFLAFFSAAKFPSPSSPLLQIVHFSPYSLSDTDINIIEIPFPQNVQGVPLGVESTDKLPSISLLPNFVIAAKLMKPHFENALESLPPVIFMITDGFLGWTLDSANKFGIPRLVYYGMSAFSRALTKSAASVLRTEVPDDEPFEVPDLPWIKITRNDFDLPFRDREPKVSFTSLSWIASLQPLKAMVYL